jgi:hypothetical protein
MKLHRLSIILIYMLTSAALVPANAQQRTFAKLNVCLGTSVNRIGTNGGRPEYEVSIKNRCVTEISWTAEGRINTRSRSSVSFISGRTRPGATSTLRQLDDSWLVYECPEGFKLGGSHQPSAYGGKSLYNCVPK